MPTYYRDEHKIVIRKTLETDLPFISELYRNVAITKENVKVKLSTLPESFAYVGGIFDCIDEERLRSLTENPSNVLWTAEYDDSIVGFVWYEAKKTTTFGKNLAIFPDYFGKVDDLLSNQMDNIADGHDVISFPPKVTGAVALLLFRQMMIDLYSKGFTYLHGCLYQINSYEDEKGLHSTPLVNEPSYRLLSSTGGEHVGNIEHVILIRDGFKVDVTEYKYIWQTKMAEQIINDILLNKNWREQP